MAHKTLVGGTAYEISGGKTLVGGTAYSIAGGKTLVDGTAYEVSFGSKTVTITISNSGSKGGCYVSYNGTSYYTATTFTANIGDTIYCRARNSEKNRVYVNDVRVASNSDDAGVDYSYTVVSDATIRFNYDNPNKTYIYITDANA